MSHVDRDLLTVFGDDAPLLRRLMAADAHARTLAERFGVLDNELHGIALGTLSAMADDVMETMKKQRLALLDEIAAMLLKAKREAVA